MEMDLRNIEWGEFVIQDLFITKIGKNIDGNKINKIGRIAYITRKESNNGVDGFINYNNEYLTHDYPVITIGNETAEPFVQIYHFFTGTKVNILIPKQEITKHALLFIAQALKQHKSKYSYSFTINSTRLKRQIIQLPINNSGNPNYAFMEHYMRQKEQEKLAKFKSYIEDRINKVSDFKEIEPLNQKEWGEFYLKDIFPKIQRGRRLKKEDHKLGKIPYVSSKAINNGIDGFVSNKDKVRIFENCLTIANSGSVGATFYQITSFVASDHVTKLENIDFSEYIYLFISGISKRLSEKYSFNREINDKRIQCEKILLPINHLGTPDYDYMENYIKRLEYDRLIKYLKIKTSCGNCH